MIEQLSFIVFSVLILGFFLVAVLSKSMLYSLSALAGGMVFLPSFYFMLDAESLGAIQITVYSGVVLGIYSFAMMFLDASKDFKERLKFKKNFFALIGLSLVGLFVSPMSFKLNSVDVDLPFIDTALFDLNRQLAFAIFSKYLLAFEFVALLLLIALACAIVLTRKELIKEKQ